MTRKRQLRFTIIRGLVAILIALLVATVLIFISAEVVISLPPSKAHEWGLWQPGH